MSQQNGVPKPPQRWRSLTITREFLSDLLCGLDRPRTLLGIGLPANARIVQMCAHPLRKAALWAIVESPDFTPVPDGQPLPEIEFQIIETTRVG